MLPDSRAPNLRPALYGSVVLPGFVRRLCADASWASLRESTSDGIKKEGEVVGGLFLRWYWPNTSDENGRRAAAVAITTVADISTCRQAALIPIVTASATAAVVTVSRETRFFLLLICVTLNASSDGVIITGKIRTARERECQLLSYYSSVSFLSSKTLGRLG